MVQEHGVRNIDISPSCRFNLQAEINVVKGDSHFLVETAHSIKLALLDDQACGCHRAHILGRMRHPKVSGIAVWKEPVCVASRFSDSNDNSRVLNAPILVKKFCSRG